MPWTNSKSENRRKKKLELYANADWNAQKRWLILESPVNENRWKFEYEIKHRTKTGQNYLKSAFAQNEMCQKGVLLRSKGDKTATCPGWPAGCTANTDRYKSLSNCHLSECQSRQDICNSITEADITVEHCRTEGDSNLHKDVTESMQDVDPSHQVNCLADLVHLSQTQFRSAKRKTFSDS